MNGFHSDRGSFYLPRALVTPPESHQKRIFPLAEQWLEKMNNGEAPKTISGIKFLNLLVELRVIILQDAVVLKNDFPDHPVFCHDIFQSDEFKSFAEESTAAMDESVPPAEIEIRRAMPFVDERFNNLSVATGELSRQVTSLQQASSSNESTGATQSKIDDLSAKINDMDAKVDGMYSVITSIAQKMDIGMPPLSAAESSSSVTGQRRPRPDQNDDDARPPQRQRISTHYTLSATVSSVSDLWK
jgi:hypothetical protein